ncbi:MAG: DsbA family protein [Trueperaceae bacterium]
MNQLRRPTALLLALTALLAPTWAVAQIGLPLAEMVAVAALQLEDAEGDAPALARTDAGTELLLEVRGSALARVGGEAVFDEQTIADVARVIAAATGYFDAIEEPVAGFLQQNLPTLAGAGPFAVGVESFRLSLDVSGAAAPYRVVWSISLAEVPEQAFLPARHAIGPDDARYVIREFSDLQCPFCARFAEQVFPALVATLLARDDVRFEYHHLVLGGRFANSGLAAEATECVADANADDPTAFWVYLDALFERQQAWSSLPDPAPYFARLALEVGLSDEGVAACLDARTHLEAVQASTARAAEIGVGGTPTVFVGPYQLRDFSRLESYLEAMARIDAFTEEAAAVAGSED